jgi:hypothetical protein
LIDWFKIEIIYPKTVNLSGEELDSDESWRVPKDDDIYSIETGYFNLTDDPIAQLNPRAFIPSEKKNRKQFTEIVFLSGNVTYAVGNPESVYQKVAEYLKAKD